MFHLLLIPLLLCIGSVHATPYTGTFPLPLTSKDVLISFPKNIWGGYPSATKWAIDHYGWSVESPAPISGSTTSKSRPSQLIITRTQDEISPLFFQAQVKGTVIGPIYIYTATKTLKFETCYFTNYIDQNAANDEKLREQITISFGKMIYDMKRFDAMGKEVGIFSGGYDFTTGQVF